MPRELAQGSFSSGMWRNLLVAVAGAGGAQPVREAVPDAAIGGGVVSCGARAQALRQSRTSSRDVTEQETMSDSVPLKDIGP